MNLKIGNKTVLSFGSNCGKRRENVESAISRFSEILRDCKFSTIYETPEYHGSGKIYMNAVGVGYTEMEYSDLLEAIKRYEVGCGRDGMCRERGDVPIDIDIVVWNGDVCRPQDFLREFFKIGYEALQPTS